MGKGQGLTVHGDLSDQWRPLDFVLWIFKIMEIRFSPSSENGTQEFERSRQALPLVLFKENLGLNENSKATLFLFVLGKGEPRGLCAGAASGKACHCLSCGWVMIQASHLLT